MFCGGYAELVECLLEIIHERLPFFGRDVQVFVRFAHGASGIFLRAAARPANHFGDEILEAGRWNLVMRFVHKWVGIEPRISHDAVNEIVNDARNAINSAEAFVK